MIAETEGNVVVRIVIDNIAYFVVVVVLIVRACRGKRLKKISWCLLYVLLCFAIQLVIISPFSPTFEFGEKRRKKMKSKISLCFLSGKGDDGNSE